MKAKNKKSGEDHSVEWELPEWDINLPEWDLVLPEWDIQLPDWNNNKKGAESPDNKGKRMKRG